VIQNWNRVAAVAMVLAMAAPSQASGPEGSGNIAVVAQWLPLRQNSGFDLNGQVFQLSADTPLFSGLGVRIDLGESDAFSHGAGYGPGFSYDNHLDTRSYNFNAFLNIYPAAWLDRTYRPGTNANPDGWLLWPSLALGFSGIKSNQFSSGLNINLGVTTTHSDLVILASQDLNYAVTLPIVWWLSVGGSYYRNFRYDASDANSSMTSTSFDRAEGEAASTTFYFNLVPGADSDLRTAFLPHFGRLGEMSLNLSWQRDLDMYNPFGSYFTNSYGINLGAPVTQDLSGAITFSQTNYGSGGVPERSYGLMLSWALGDPKGRVSD
jgi:hypothetical protein